jgi:hypothetical protein
LLVWNRNHIVKFKIISIISAGCSIENADIIGFMTENAEKFKALLVYIEVYII